MEARGGRRDEVDPVRHLIVTATGWGLNPDKDAIYLNVTPSKNDGNDDLQAQRRRMCRSMASGRSAVYNAEGYFEKNDLNAYSLNSITAKKSADGSVAVQFGGCDGKIPELPADHAGLELHGAPLSPAHRNPGRYVEFPGGAAGPIVWT